MKFPGCSELVDRSGFRVRQFDSKSSKELPSFSAVGVFPWYLITFGDAVQCLKLSLSIS